MPGSFVVSLDFELFWGVRDHRSLEEYGRNILGVRKALPAMLDLFTRYQIRSTFATVGFLFFDSKDSLLAACPEIKPSYQNPTLSPYQCLAGIGQNEEEDPYHFGANLLRLIQQTPGQEIGTHTFSHYYCLEEGQQIDQFQADLTAARKVADREGIPLHSIVFPRNQYNPDYLEVCRQLGIYVYRGNESHWLYAARNRDAETSFRRAFRLLDAYLNLSGHHTFTWPIADSRGLVNVPASRFLRPYSQKLAWLDSWRCQRILNSMSHAAKYNEVYHLWWHPHNFGLHCDENIAFLEKILEHYSSLQKQYGFTSRCMSDFLPPEPTHT
ncbi:MAG: polysaccharide deacetylase family protein [Cytophagaceae bacterium]|jgi:peptidoglycan/xylan/chitin deacetylase (PgdA/CDA1 family)|nr:polysaccharide deacetylase family protein [Cytophagaceae bacterium]